MEYAFLTLVALCCFVTVMNWRVGLYACLIIDVVRDPIRKLVDDQPVWVTIAGAIPWMVVMLRAFHTEQTEFRAMVVRYPQMLQALGVFLVALAPGFFLSCVLYPSGYILAFIGAASYLGPFVGLALGYLFVREEETLFRFFKAYVLVNSVAMIGTPLEFLNYDVPALGGIRVDWIRYREGYTVDLITGFYRSPDVMGLHAAHIMMFGLILASRARSLFAAGWLTTVLWGAACLVLCGRRKMIAIPAIFILTYLGLSLFYGAPRRVRAVTRIVFAGAVAVGIFLLVNAGQHGNEYAEYASTTLSELPDRLSRNVIEGAQVSVRQSGVLGGGLGTGTQGRYYTGVQTGRAARGWQEDAIGRILLEVGVPGLVLMLLSGWCVLRSFQEALSLVPRESSVRDLQLLLIAVVAGDLASFLVAHQHFSGDPVSALIVTLLAGCVLGAPRVSADRSSMIAAR
ncbi:MAG TPA: hypothetical protein VFG20_23450 [Planctomycetaceae bacterium]|nr:hypothetical protein [Planctomycetaceae bacterium]